MPGGGRVGVRQPGAALAVGKQLFDECFGICDANTYRLSFLHPSGVISNIPGRRAGPVRSGGRMVMQWVTCGAMIG